MKKNNVFKIIIAILVILNIGLLTFITQGKNIRRWNGERTADERFKKRFGFDNSQMAVFLSSKKEHKAEIAVLKPKLEALGLAYYHQTDTLQQKQILDSILITTKAIYTVNNAHFNDIRAVCRQDQRSHMDGFINSLLRKIQER